MTTYPRLGLLLGALATIGCSGKSDGDDDTGSSGTTGVPTDDCVPGNPDIHPDAEEVCDGIDNNCDGQVDEGVLSTFYADADADGFGGSTTIEACAAPEGFTENASDCDDLDPAAYPGGAEVCDGVDNNCDGLVDDADPSVDLSGGSTFHLDADRDGYGDAGSSMEACTAPPGYVDNDADCDDSDAMLHPDTVWYGDLDDDGFGDTLYTATGCVQPAGHAADSGDCDDFDAAVHPAADELCDAIDNNCDGTVDENTAVDASLWYADADADGFGEDATTLTECDPPSGYTARGGDCDDTDDAVHPDAFEYCDTVDNDCDGVTDFPWSVPTDYSTVQAAIDALSDGDSFCLEAGTYTETLSFSGKGIGIIGSGATTTIIDGGGSQLLELSAGESVTLGAVTLQNAYGSEGGLASVTDGSSLTVQEAILTDVGCGDSGTCYGGAFLVDTSTLVLSGVDIELDYATDGTIYGGVVHSEESTLSFDDVHMSASSIDNLASTYYLYGGFIRSTGDVVSMEDVSYVGNTLSSGYSTYGGFAYLDDVELDADGLVVDDNAFNSTGSVYSDTTGAFFYLSGESSDIDLTGVSIQGNTVSSNDDLWSLIYCQSCGQAAFNNTLIADNVCQTVSAVSSNGAYGLAYVYVGTLAFTNVDVVGNDFAGFDYLYGAVGYRSYGGDFVITNTTIAGNTATDVDVTYASWMYGAYGQDTGFGQVDINYANIYDNWAASYYGYDFYDDGSEADLSGFLGLQEVDPLYTDASSGDYTLGTGSTLIDAGDPSILDSDGTPSDIGAYGGPLGGSW